MVFYAGLMTGLLIAIVALGTLGLVGQYKEWF